MGNGFLTGHTAEFGQKGSNISQRTDRGLKTIDVKPILKLSLEGKNKGCYVKIMSKWTPSKLVIIIKLVQLKHVSH